MSLSMDRWFPEKLGESKELVNFDKRVPACVAGDLKFFSNFARPMSSF